MSTLLSPALEDLTIAAKINNTLPAGTYSTQLVVSVVGNAPKPVGLSSISTMQAMTSSICSNTSIGTEQQLRDTRDGSYYYVRKMSDGKCWMVQNLSLGSTSFSTPLSSADSNLSGNWSLPASYTSVTSGTSSATAVQSWNFGKWVLATPLLGTGCGNSTTGQELSNCTKVGFVDVSSSSFSSGYTATTRSWDGANSNTSTLVAVNCTTWSGSGTSKICTAGTYDAHYLVGNYYSWNAATAETGVGLTSGEAGGSICPKGWKLPTSNTTVIGSFAGLLSQYGVDSSPTGGLYNIAGAPLRFIRGGDVKRGSYVERAGQYGIYWSSTANSTSTYAYQLSFSNTNVDPDYARYRYNGFSVRCIAQ